MKSNITKSLRRTAPKPTAQSTRKPRCVYGPSHNVPGMKLARLVAEEKAESKLSNSLRLSARSSLGGYLGDHVYRIASGSRTNLSTSAASVMQFGLPTGAILAASLSTTIVPEMAAFIVIFDEVKVAGIHVEYHPINPFNRGVSVVSIPIALFWDEVDTFVPTNTSVGMGAQAQRKPLYVEFSPDVSLSHTFMRPSNLDEMPWTPVNNLGTQTSTLGGLYVIGDGTNTASTTYGFLQYQFLLQFRARF